MSAVLLLISNVRLSIPTPCMYGVRSTSAVGCSPLKSNGQGGSNVTVVAVLLRTFRYTRIERNESGKPPRFCAQTGNGFGAIAIGAPTTNLVVLATVIVLLPLVAPDVMEIQFAGSSSGGGHVASPAVKIGLLFGPNKVVRPIPAPRRVMPWLFCIWSSVSKRKVPSGI